MMRYSHVNNYFESLALSISLDMLWHHLSWAPHDGEIAKTLDPWGQPFYLSNNSAPYVPVFIRTADRALYHACNAWRFLANDLQHVHVQDHMFGGIEPGSRIFTNDHHIAYEIEAFLAAAMAITDRNLIGIEDKGLHNRLGKSTLALGMPLAQKLRQEADNFQKLGMDSKWRHIRDSAFHLKAGMNAWSNKANIEKKGSTFFVRLEGVHYVEGATIDFIDLFSEAFSAFRDYVLCIRNLLTDYAFEKLYVRANKFITPGLDQLGVFFAEYGPEGHSARYFPERRTDFVGPIGLTPTVIDLPNLFYCPMPQA